MGLPCGPAPQPVQHRFGRQRVIGHRLQRLGIEPVMRQAAQRTRHRRQCRADPGIAVADVPCRRRVAIGRPEPPGRIPFAGARRTEGQINPCRGHDSPLGRLRCLLYRGGTRPEGNPMLRHLAMLAFAVLGEVA